MKLFFKKVSTLPLTLVGVSQREARETGALPRFSRPVGQLPSQSRLPPCQLPRRGSQVSPPPLGEVSCLWHDGEGTPLARPPAFGKPPSRCATKSLRKAKSRLPPWGRCPPVGGGEGSGKPSSRCATGREKRFAVSLAFFLAAAHKGKVVGRCPTPRNPLKRVDLNFTWLPAGLYHSSSFPPHLQGPGGI